MYNSLKNKLRHSFNRLSSYFRRVYRLSLNIEKQELTVWKDLKKLHEDANWKCGVYESDKQIKTVFELGNETGAVFNYFIYDNNFHCAVKILDNFPREYTSEAFILASHFNNLLNRGKVVIDAEDNYITYQTKKNILIPLLYPETMYEQIIRHINTARDVQWAYQRLMDENEAPAIIIADLLRKNSDENPSE